MGLQPRPNLARRHLKLLRLGKLLTLPYLALQNNAESVCQELSLAGEYSTVGQSHECLTSVMLTVADGLLMVPVPRYGMNISQAAE